MVGSREGGASPSCISIVWMLRLGTSWPGDGCTQRGGSPSGVSTLPKQGGISPSDSFCSLRPGIHSPICLSQGATGTYGGYRGVPHPYQAGPPVLC